MEAPPLFMGHSTAVQRVSGDSRSGSLQCQAACDTRPASALQWVPARCAPLKMLCHITPAQRLNDCRRAGAQRQQRCSRQWSSSRR